MDQYAFYSKSFKTIGCVFNWDGVPEEDRHASIISLNVPAGKHFLGKMRSFIRRVVKLRNIKKQLGVDISISHLEGADYINILSKSQEKIICWIHGSKKFDRNITGFQGLLRRKFLMPLLYNKASQIVTVSNGIRQEIMELVNPTTTQLATIYNGFDLITIQKKAEEAAGQMSGLAENHFIIMVHCRFAREKNLQGLLKLYSRLRESAPLTKLVILGDGELRLSLIHLCQSLRLKSYFFWDNMKWHHDYEVYFPGLQLNPFPYLKHASLYAMTSLNEGFPLSLCEAMACGLPVISSDCHTGPREIFAPGLDISMPVPKPYLSECGILMPLPDSSETHILWADFILTLMTDTKGLIQLADSLFTETMPPQANLIDSRNPHPTPRSSDNHKRGGVKADPRHTTDIGVGTYATELMHGHQSTD